MAGLRHRAAAAACLAAAACGSGGGADTGGSGTGTLPLAAGALRLMASSPAEDAVQVPLDARIVLEFDAPIVADSLRDQETWLRPAGTDTGVPGSWLPGSNPRAVQFVPQQALAAETDYVFQLSALTCDHEGRILEVDRTLRFRTFDATPPALVSVDVVDGGIRNDRTAPFRIELSEAPAANSVTAATVYLRDGFGTVHPCSRAVQGALILLQPLADLPGDRAFTLIVTTGLRDRAGNALPQTRSVRFRTGIDTDAPSVLVAWPPNGRSGQSPRLQPQFTFSESMDPLTVESASLLFQDEFGSMVPFVARASSDQRQLRIEPLRLLTPGRTYTVAFLLGAAAATDVSGNPLQGTQAMVFTVGTDADPPVIGHSQPGNGDRNVSRNAVLRLRASEPLDPDFVHAGNVRLEQAGAATPAVVTLVGGDTIQVTPVEYLAPDAAYTVLLQGGPQGLHDLAGNPLAIDHTVSFRTAASAALPQALLLPADGAVGVPRSARITVVFDLPMAPESITADTLQVLDELDQPVPGAVRLANGDRVATFTPGEPLAAATNYRTRVRGGADGVRERSGNWLSDDRIARFRTGVAADLNPPQVRVTLNAIDELRRDGLVVPPHGFTIDVAASDPGEHSLDMGSVQLEFRGAVDGPTAEQFWASAAITHGSARWSVPVAAALGTGSWTLTVAVADLSGNVGRSSPLTFQVQQPTADILPFERTHVVWVRTDLDRDGNGRADFDDDLLRLGFQAAGDPAGTNARMRELLLGGILTQANRLFGRGRRSEPLGPDSVRVMLCPREPLAVQHMQIALGGLDPEGDRRRDYGAESTGVLGRAFYDHRNARMNDRNIGTSPGLGVFPAEMWLYQSRIHRQVWPSFQTLFAQRFQPLCPAMGGVAAGAHPLDGVVLAPGFRFEQGNSEQRARWSVVMQAADDWAAVIGVILAHEVGHTVGLVAAGPMPAGLFGDTSLHNNYGSAAEVMAAAVGYEAMVTLTYSFRDVDLAYLRQRVLLR